MWNASDRHRRKTTCRMSVLFLVLYCCWSGVVGQPEEGLNTNTTNTGNSTLESEPTCVSSASEFLTALAVERVNSTAIVTVTICPNTRILSEPPPATATPGQGLLNLLISAANTHIRCGPNGMSSDNCTLANSAEVDPETPTLLLLFLGQSLDNIKISGVTFDGSSSGGAVAVSLVTSGYVEFCDCIFMNYRATRNGVIGLVYNNGQISVVFDTCRFENNTVRAFNSTTSVALVYMASNEQSAVFQKTTFQNNHFELEDSTIPTWAINNFLDSKTSLIVQDCCFINNTFNAPYVVLAKESDDYTVANNYVDTFDCELCTFFQIGTFNQTGKDNCTEADLTTCSFDKTLKAPSTQSRECGVASSAPQQPHVLGFGGLVFLMLLRSVL